MTFLNRAMMVSVFILLSLVSGAHGGLTISAFTGDASGSSGYTEFLNAKINDQLHENTALAGSSLSQSFSGTVSKAETFSVTNRFGDHADVGYNIINPSSLYSGSYTLSPKSAGYAQATEKLSVPAADSIYVFANANSRDGKKYADALVTVTDGSLIGYQNSAYATLGEAAVTQQAKTISGDEIWTQERAGLQDGSETAAFVGEQAWVPGIIQNGQMTGYYGVATALTDSVRKGLSIDSLSGEFISLGPYAWNKLTGADNILKLTNGQISGYSQKATATRSSASSSSNINKANGESIYVLSDASNLEGDKSTATTQMTNFELSTYSTNTQATTGIADTRQSATSASGSQIYLDTKANNKELDYVKTHLYVDGGSVAGYAATSTGTMTQATASDSINFVSARNNIISQDEAGNKEGDDAYLSAGQPCNTIILDSTSSISNYKTSLSADGTQAIGKVKNADGQGDVAFQAYSRNGNILGHYTMSNLYNEITDGQLSKYSSTAKATQTMAKTTVNIGSAQGSKILLDSVVWDATNSAGGTQMDFAKNVEISSNIAHGNINNYKAYATANGFDSAETSQHLQSASGSSIEAHGIVKNQEGDNANVDLDMGTGSLTSYSNTATATKTDATASQSANSAKCAIGANIIFDSSANNKEGDHVKSFAELYGGIAPYLGSISGYSNTATSKLTKATTKQSAIYISGDLIESSEEADNSESDRSTTNTRTTQGQLSKYSDTSEATQTKTTTTINLNARGSSIDVHSHAENQNPADESTDGNQNGKIDPTEVNIVKKGEADFKVSSTGNLPTSIYTEANTKDVYINPILRNNIKTAILLEPFYNEFGGVYDQVAPILVNKGYAVLRYTDSGASENKFADLNQYNIVLINSHMSENSIKLSTPINPNNPGETESLNSRYLGEMYYSIAPPRNAMVILNGCESHKWDLTNWWPAYFTTLSSSFDLASMRLGYAKVAWTNWEKDSMTEYFNKMASGETAKQALDYINGEFKTNWDKTNDPNNKGYSAPLVFKGDKKEFGTFTL